MLTAGQSNKIIIIIRPTHWSWENMMIFGISCWRVSLSKLNKLLVDLSVVHQSYLSKVNFWTMNIRVGNVKWSSRSESNWLPTPYQGVVQPGELLEQMVGKSGFEPPLQESQSCVLPLHYNPRKMEPPVGIEPTTYSFIGSRPSGYERVALPTELQKQ